MPGIIPVHSFQKDRRETGRARWVRGLVLCFLALFSPFLPGAFAKGKGEEPEPPRNGEWVAVVCAFDVSALPPSRRNLGSLAARNLAASLGRLDRRFRPSGEGDYYEGAARSGLLTEAGKKLLAKWDERDRLRFQGETEWRYQVRLAAIEAEIEKLEEELKAAGDKAIPVVPEPALTVPADNRNGVFPPPPLPGEEYRFCVNQKADAFLTGTLTEYYGRIYLTVRMYTVYSRSFQYEDRTIFSVEDVALGTDDLAGRLNAVAAGTTAAALAVRVDPEEALILVGTTLAGQGSTGVVERTPGTVRVEAFAEGHETVSLPVELAAGELTELTLSLSPAASRAIPVEVPESPGSSVYQGSLFVGVAPLSITLPEDRYGYVTIETPDEKTESLTFNNDWQGSLVFQNPQVPRSPEEEPLEEARRGYYGSWGRLWIAGSLTLLISGLFTGYETAYNSRGTASQTLYDQGNLMGYVRIGAFVATGLVAADWIYRFIRYVYTANKDAARRAK